jgi:antitoxin VapB
VAGGGFLGNHKGAAYGAPDDAVDFVHGVAPDISIALFVLNVYTLCINIETRGRIMAHAIKTAAVFKSGNSQAVRLPKDFQFDVREVEILRRGDEVVLRRIPTNLSAAFDLLAGLPDDFMADGRNDTPPQVREEL